MKNEEMKKILHLTASMVLAMERRRRSLWSFAGRWCYGERMVIYAMNLDGDNQFDVPLFQDNQELPKTRYASSRTAGRGPGSRCGASEEFTSGVSRQLPRPQT